METTGDFRNREGVCRRMRDRDKEVAAHFRAALKTAKERKGLRNYQLADAAGVVPTNISNYLNGKQMPSSSVLMKLARALDMEPEALLPGSGRALSGRNGQDAEAYVIGGRRALDELEVLLRELRKRWESHTARAALSSSDAVKKLGQDVLRARRSKGS